MGGTARFGSHLPEKSDSQIRQFARTDDRYKYDPAFKTTCLILFLNFTGMEI